ncbi:Spy/CpxP family protein refolding chaperone [Limnobacter humi]|uniref:Spy/CpxP family protein refolding chaperone n=1 Tax=Limnobacter humi TaxID=1778671 RepID=A0ABT1WCQ6_9BURK|nr:Spy/CpxP family protein refolding chaperone [Limnobacter humi]MCQ8895301.1 Spy/CpxP family protein refolding chaperone [Limnobacter humi]
MTTRVEHTNTRHVYRWLAASAFALALPWGAAQAATPNAGDATAAPPPPHEMRGGPGHGPERREHGPMAMLKKLNLTPEQDTQVKQILDKQHARMEGRREAHKAHHAEMRALVESDTFDQAKATRLIQQQQQQELNDRLAMLQTQHDIYKVLTPEQRSKLKALEERREQRWKDRDAKKPAK